MVRLSIHVHAALLAFVHARPRRDERGQTSAEYALVLLIVAWATKTDLIGKLFTAVLDAITGKVK